MEIGDKVVIRKDSEYPDGPFKIGIVEKLTKTQVIVDGQRFMLRYPNAEYGHSDLYTYYDRLVPDMTPEQAHTRNTEWRKQYEIDKKRSKIRNFRWNSGNVSDEQIVKVYDLMESMGLFKE